MKRIRLSRRNSTLVSLVLLALVLLGQHYGWFDQAAQEAVEHQPGLYTVERFVDGDTIAVKMGSTTETVRMIGIDTPETHKPNTPVQCYGPAAAAYTQNLIGASKVRLESDSRSQNRDRYNRLLRYVYLPDNRLVQEELIRNGYGFAYTSFPFGKKDQFVAAQQAARQEAKGLWANCAPFEQQGRWQTEAQG